jgi:site-specific DNA-methyltransferase (adenine-specific)
MSLPLNQILQGDCVEVMKGFPSESVDIVVTDPPYGIGFMGKEWDRALPPKEAFQECFRVLKAGGLAFVMSSPRQDVLWRMMRMLEECGFELRQSFVSWVYASGFPKALDVSKMIDKKLGREREKEPITYRKFENIAGGNFNRKDGQTESTKVLYNSFPASDEARKWQGWKSQTGLKPALECILMVNKPFAEKKIIDQVLKTGTGAVNVDACRIPFQSNQDYEDRKRGILKTPPLGRNEIYGDMEVVDTDKYVSEKGRFPANLLVSDNALDDGVSGQSKGHYSYQLKKSPYEGGWKSLEDKGYVDEELGSFSRFFSLDAWAEHHGFLRVPKASKGERNEGLEDCEPKMKDAENRNPEDNGGIQDRIHGKVLKKNFHPTVKPVKLMAYLIELGCQPNGVVLDPFCGSGSTLIAAKRLCRNFIGIDLNPNYCEIARKRLATIPERLEGFMKTEEKELRS